MAPRGGQQLGVAVSGAWAAELLDQWASRYGGERENNVARLRVGAVSVTAWDVSRVGRTLLPMWAARVEVLVSCLAWLGGRVSTPATTPPPPPTQWRAPLLVGLSHALARPDARVVSRGEAGCDKAGMDRHDGLSKAGE